ncbi:conserved Plasmodium protein, unknown function [Plasmodium vivax]|uniref:Uncharacterized protein n=6 Tax=Plasmodium vivax TaxID=5855 RepID=A5K527_PLAVS|nr:hypothetical protein, conserved [Plasmodium vivax]KMZ80332.1 hypothetical protein PVIIG_03236 [Plasmodium vivax India VII]KMZ86509.1 hypothetical protein PVBG_04668 [Plasmodium vivax Brazil I]KMZ92922.1 hypothetical protein PVMG_04634 [Plasmodium vivax Mauritania I]KMZ99487.1 hypothetical protein PVNG_05308 [Plasmodium vivax North Korean]EDL45755.1 hypothetical protein, conserved [Plasmodium vivax]|eukprot:XP_001615482.1 hypothetical protein [Plasmodium vivax Sal-1]
MDENMDQVFVSYNDMIQDNECATSVESYKDVYEFLENSAESNFHYSNESQNSSVGNSFSTNEKNIPIFSYVSNNFKSKRGKKYKKCYTASYINNMSSAENFPLKAYGRVRPSRDKTNRLTNFQWKPLGKNVPEIDKINLSYKKAWDIGKEGCNGLLIKNMFESYKQKKLNYMVLDGTNIDNFLTVYSHTYQDAIKGVTPNVLRTFSFYDLENAYFMYDVKSIHIFRKVKDKDKGKSVILRGLNDNFFNAILVCMYEIVIYLNFANCEDGSTNKPSNKKKKKKGDDRNETTYYVKSARNENNAYRSNVKEVISHNKNKKKINGASGNAAVTREEKGKAERSGDFPGGGENMNDDKENPNQITLWSSNNHEEFGYEYIKDIIKKEEKELYETDKMYHNSNDEYSSHTSDSVEQ